jgi:Spy/CpxP family protein refolding chaperone
MKKVLAANCLAALIVAMLCGVLSVDPDLALAQSTIRRAKRGLDPQLGGPRNRRPPLVDPQFGVRIPNKARKRQLLNQQLMETLGVTPEQRLRMAEMKRSHDDEAIPIGRRIRQARNALDRAIMSPEVDEALVKRYTEELAAAQADQVRFQARRRVQMRRILTAEQVRRLLQLEQEQRRKVREANQDLDKEN